MIAFKDPGMSARRRSARGESAKQYPLTCLEIPRLESARIKRKSERASAPTSRAISLHARGRLLGCRQFQVWRRRRSSERSSRRSPFESRSEGIGLPPRFSIPTMGTIDFVEGPSALPVNVISLFGRARGKMAQGRFDLTSGRALFLFYRAAWLNFADCVATSFQSPFCFCSLARRRKVTLCSLP
jgi:hypothetical protein